MQAALLALSHLVGQGLHAVYLHGSAVAGGLRPRSDLDLLAVVENLSSAQRRHLMQDLLRLSGRHPAPPGGPRYLEVIAFRLCDLRESRYPARAEFVYGEWLRAGFEAGEVPEPGSDPEYTLLLAQARQQAVLLAGQDVLATLPAIPRDEVRQAMRDALPALLRGLRGDERNVLLTLARMWHTASTGEFATKDAAASWALPQLPREAAATLACARRAYLGEIIGEAEGRYEAAERLSRYLLGRVTEAL